MNFGVYAPNSGRVVNAQLKVLIADITLTNPGSFEAIPIPAGIDSIEIVASLRSTVAATSDSVYLYLNGDTTNGNYSAQTLSATGTSVTTTRGDVPLLWTCSAASSTSGDFGPGSATLINSSMAGIRRGGFGLALQRLDATNQIVRLTSYNWESTEPITNVTIRTDNHATDLFAAGSSIQVFGLDTFAVALAG